MRKKVDLDEEEKEKPVSTKHSRESSGDSVLRVEEKTPTRDEERHRHRRSSHVEDAETSPRKNRSSRHGSSGGPSRSISRSRSRSKSKKRDGSKTPEEGDKVVLRRRMEGEGGCKKKSRKRREGR
jgi:hypothetical protein